MVFRGPQLTHFVRTLAVQDNYILEFFIQMGKMKTHASESKFEYPHIYLIYLMYLNIRMSAHMNEPNPMDISALYPCLSL